MTEPNASLPDLEELSASAQEASTLLKALANRDRLMILCLIAEQERNVTELQRLLQLRQPTLSQQLSRLRSEGIVATRREGKSIYYRLVSAEVERTLELMHEMFCSEEAIARRREDRARYRGAA